MATKRKTKKAAKQPKSIGKASRTSPKKKQVKKKQTKKKNRADHLKGHRWEKGCPSPNPTGKPKGTLSLTAALKEILSQKGKGKKEKYKALIEALITCAKKGDAKLFQLIFDRVDGKLADTVVNADAGPLKDLSDAELDRIILGESAAQHTEPTPEPAEPEPAPKKKKKKKVIPK